MTAPRPLSDLRVLLAFPPQGHPTQPYLALPSLKAWLARAGLHDCTVWDLNLEAYEHMLSEDRLALAVERIRGDGLARGWDTTRAPTGTRATDTPATDKRATDAHGATAGSGGATASAAGSAPAHHPGASTGGASLPVGELERYRLWADAMASGPYVAAHIQEAKDAIRDPDAFYDRTRYLWAMRVFEAGLKLVSTEFHPSLFTAHNYTQSTSIDSTADLFAGVDHPTENMFREFYLEHALPRIEEQQPDVLGLSVTYGSQLVPALTLASLVKERWPGIHITLGGGMLAYVGQRLAQAAPLFERIDSIVVYEGERPLLELCQAIAATGRVQREATDAGRQGERTEARGGGRGHGPAADLSGVSNLLWCRDGEAVTNGELIPLPIDDLPTPDFRDLPLHLYYSGELVLPVAPTRGCYFEKCGFCTLYTAIGPTYRERSVERLVEDLQTLVARHGTPYFYFIMDDMPPLLARQIPDAFAEAGLEVFWWCDARMEERLFNAASLPRLYEAGCRKLMYGFESGSQRLLDLVEKGVDLEEAERVVRTTHEAGISATLYTMVGLPTETREEADLTRAFIVRNADWIGEISLQIFNLDMVSPMYRDPARFGIAQVVDDPRDLAPGETPRQDLARYLEHVSVSGMDREQVKQAFGNVLGAATEALAALRGDNFLYYRYKSHIFLYLCRFGRDVFRHEHHDPQERPAPVRRTAELPERLRLAPDATLTDLPFPYGPVRDRLERAWSDPTPLGGVARSESRVADDAAPVSARPSSVAFLGRTQRFLDLGGDARALLEAAATEGTAAALDLHGREHRTASSSFLARALRMGLVEGSPTP